MMRTIKKLGFKTVTEFYNDIANETLDINTVIDAYEQASGRNAQEAETRSAGDFILATNDDSNGGKSSDVLEIGDNIKGINYRLARCCNPIHGDEVFGFISSEGVVSIHKADCPNAIHMRQRYPYREVATRWSGKVGGQFATTLRVVGHDDIGIVTKITSIINKEKDIALRAISIDSNDGLFQGHLSVGVNDVGALKVLIKKIKEVKGVKDVQRV